MEITNLDLPKFGSEISREKLEKILSMMKEDIDCTQFLDGGILIEEDLTRGIVDIAMANFWDSYFRRYDLINKKRLYASDDLDEGRQHSTPGSEELRGSLMGYSLGRKQLADDASREEERRKQLISVFGEKIKTASSAPGSP